MPTGGWENGVGAGQSASGNMPGLTVRVHHCRDSLARPTVLAEKTSFGRKDTVLAEKTSFGRKDTVLATETGKHTVLATETGKHTVLAKRTRLWLKGTRLWLNDPFVAERPVCGKAEVQAVVRQKSRLW